MPVFLPSARYVISLALLLSLGDSLNIANNSLILPANGRPCPCVGAVQLRLLRKERELLEHERILGLALLKQLQILRQELGSGSYRRRRILTSPASSYQYHLVSTAQPRKVLISDPQSSRERNNVEIYENLLPPEHGKVASVSSNRKIPLTHTYTISDRERRRRSMRRKKRRIILEDLKQLEYLEDVPPNMRPPSYHTYDSNQQTLKRKEVETIGDIESELPVELPPEKSELVLGTSPSDLELEKIEEEREEVKRNRRMFQDERFRLERLRKQRNEHRAAIVSAEIARRKLEREELARKRLLLEKQIQNTKAKYDRSHRISDGIKRILHKPKNKLDADIERRKQRLAKLEEELLLQRERLRLREEKDRIAREVKRERQRRADNDEKSRLERERLRFEEAEARLIREKRRLQNQKLNEKRSRRVLKNRIQDQFGISTDNDQYLVTEDLGTKEQEERRILEDVVKLKMKPLPSLDPSINTPAEKENQRAHRTLELKQDAVDLEKIRLEKEEIKGEIFKGTANSKETLVKQKMLEKLAKERDAANLKKETQAEEEHRMVDQRLLEKSNAVEKAKMILTDIANSNQDAGVVNSNFNSKKKRAAGQVVQYTEIGNLIGNAPVSGSTLNKPSPTIQTSEQSLPASYFTSNDLLQSVLQQQEANKKAYDIAFQEVINAQKQKKSTLGQVDQYAETGNLVASEPVLGMTPKTPSSNSQTIQNSTIASSFINNELAKSIDQTRKSNKVDHNWVLQEAINKARNKLVNKEKLQPYNAPNNGSISDNGHVNTDRVDPEMLKSSQERQSDFETNKAEIMTKKENAEADKKRLNDELTYLKSIPQKNVTTRLRISIVETQINRTKAELLQLQYEMKLNDREHSWIEKEIKELEEAAKLDEEKLRMEAQITSKSLNSTERARLMAELEEVESKIDWLSKQAEKSDAARFKEEKLKAELIELRNRRKEKELELSQVDEKLRHIARNRNESQYTLEDRKMFEYRPELAREIEILRSRELLVLQTRLKLLKGLVKDSYISPYSQNTEEKSSKLSQEAESKEAKLAAEGPSISGMNVCDKECVEKRKRREEIQREKERRREENRLRKLAKHQAIIAERKKLAERLRIERLRKHQILLEERRKLHELNKKRRLQGLPNIPYTPVLSKRNVTWTSSGIGAELGFIDEIIQKEKKYLVAGLKRNDTLYCNERRKRIDFLMDRKKMLNLRLDELRSRIEMMKTRDAEARKATDRIQAERAMWLATHNLSDPFNITADSFIILGENLQIRDARNGIRLLDNEMNITNVALEDARGKNQTHLIILFKQRLLVLQERRRYLKNLIDHLSASNELKSSFNNTVTIKNVPMPVTGTEEDLITVDSDIRAANEKLEGARRNNQTQLTQVLEERIRLLQNRRLELQSILAKLQAEKTKQDAEKRQKRLDKIRRRQEARKKRLEKLKRMQTKLRNKRREIQNKVNSTKTKKTITYHWTTYVNGKNVSTHSHQVPDNSTLQV